MRHGLAWLECPERAERLELAEVDDPDFDGLEGYDEAQYGTDPRNPDTDGDGFKDGDEVEAGYNPNGQGSLSSD